MIDDSYFNLFGSYSPLSRTVLPTRPTPQHGERGGSVVECRTPEREVRGSRPTSAVLCPWARHFTPRKYWLITQEARAPSRHDWKIVDWDVKPQHNQPTPQHIAKIFFICRAPVSQETLVYIYIFITILGIILELLCKVSKLHGEKMLLTDAFGHYVQQPSSLHDVSRMLRQPGHLFTRDIA